MSNANPIASMEALFPVPIDCGLGVEVYPLTLGHYALLEKVKSYLVDESHTPDSIEVIRTFYICTRRASSVVDFLSNGKLDELDKLAFEWAETLPPVIYQNIMAAIEKQINAMMKVIPITGDNDKKKVEAGTVS